MVRHWLVQRTQGWRSSAVINGFGAVVTGIVLLIVAMTKAAEGAWIIIVMIPTLVATFEITRRHYDHVAAELRLGEDIPAHSGGHVVLLPIGGVQRAVVKALRYARTLSNDVRAVYVEIDPSATPALRQVWAHWADGVPLVVLRSPYRSLMEPLLEYVDQLRDSDPDGYITVILPEFVPRRLWHHLLHNQHALLIKAALLFRPNVVVTSVPFHLGRENPTPIGAAVQTSADPAAHLVGSHGGRS
jgi:hypothetical protein